MNTVKISYLVYAEGTDSEGNRFYFEKDKTKDLDLDIEPVANTELDCSLLDSIEKDIEVYESKRTSYAFNKSNYKRNKIYGFNDDYPGVTIPVGKVKTTRMEIAEIEVI